MWAVAPSTRRSGAGTTPYWTPPPCVTSTARPTTSTSRTPRVFPCAEELRRANVYPDIFSLAQAHQAFSAQGRITDPQLQNWFESNITGFLDLVEAVKHYPCAKSAWIEFLGEADTPPIHRVQQ